MKLRALFVLLVMASMTLMFCAGTPEADQTTEKFFFVSHTRVNKAKHPQTINAELKNIDLSQYDMVLIGGDLTLRISEDERTIKHVNDLLHLDQENTLWALGNHDYYDMDLIQKYTGRPNYYTKWHNGVTFIVLDTQEDYTKITGDQLKMYKAVMDTVQVSKHVIILHHKLMWWEGNDSLVDHRYIANAPRDTCFDCLNPSNFYQDVYPAAVQVRKKGIGVVFVGGDIGFSTSRFEMQTPDSVVLLANGLHGFRKNWIGKNKYLEFEYDPIIGELDWQFKALWMHAQYPDSLQQKIDAYREYIMSEKELAENVQNKADKKGHTFNEQLQLDAIRVSVPSELEALKAHKRKSIYKNPDWYDKLVKKAADKGISIEEEIEENIDWMIAKGLF